MMQNYRRTILGIGTVCNFTAPTADGLIDGPDRRHIAGLFRGHPNTNRRRNYAGTPINVLPPTPDGSIARDAIDGSDVRHMAGVWRSVIRIVLPWHLFFGRNG